MRLAELGPVWLEKGRERVGVMFWCPCPKCRDWHRKVRLTCFWVGMPIWGSEEWDGTYSGQMGCIRRALDLIGRRGEKENAVVPCKDGLAWQREGDTFDALTLRPSLDASAAGHWHGHITNGEVA